MIIKRRLILCFLLTVVLFAFGAMIAGEALADDWYSRLWGYRKMITVQAGQIIGGPHTDFPMLVSLASDADLAANAQPDFDDILFTSSDGTTKLDHEIESFNSGTGALIAWVRIPAPGINNGTVIYMYYGNSSVGSQQNVTGTWGSSYAAVWHLSEDPFGTPPQINDSTINNNDGTSNGSMTSGDQVAGQVDGSLDLDGGDDYVNVTDPGISSLDTTLAFTISVWIYPIQISPGVRYGVISKRKTAITRSGYFLGLDNEAWCDDDPSDSEATIGFHYGEQGGIYAECTGLGVVSPNEWTYIAVTYNATGGVRAIYKNGVLQSTISTRTISTIETNNESLFIGKGHYDAPFNGTIDEARVSNVARSAGWIETSYNNQNAPSSFLSFDVQELVPVPTMTEWGMIIFVVLAGLGSIYYLRRKRIEN